MQLTSELEKTFHSTIRLEILEDGACIRQGTAFVYEYQTEDNLYPFLVTAKSTIEGANEGRMTLTQAQENQPVVGKSYTLDIEQFEKLWYPHPDESLDLAITPFVPFVKHIESSGTPIYFYALGPEFLPAEESSAIISLTDDLFFIGYPEHAWDMSNLIPVLRKGVIASPPSLDYGGLRAFAMDAPVVNGSSGSPVFNAMAGSADKPTLLGMLVNLINRSTEQQAAHVATTSMGAVIRVEAIVEVISGYLHEKGFI